MSMNRLKILINILIKDRVSAENTMQLLRERSRTITNLSMKKRDSIVSMNQTDDAKLVSLITISLLINHIIFISILDTGNY